MFKCEKIILNDEDFNLKLEQLSEYKKLKGNKYNFNEMVIIYLENLIMKLLILQVIRLLKDYLLEIIELMGLME